MEADAPSTHPTDLLSRQPVRHHQRHLTPEQSRRHESRDAHDHRQQKPLMGKRRRCGDDPDGRIAPQTPQRQKASEDPARHADGNPEKFRRRRHGHLPVGETTRRKHQERRQQPDPTDQRSGPPPQGQAQHLADEQAEHRQDFTARGWMRGRKPRHGRHQKPGDEAEEVRAKLHAGVEGVGGRPSHRIPHPVPDPEEPEEDPEGKEQPVRLTSQVGPRNHEDATAWRDVGT